jgi:protein TonB
MNYAYDGKFSAKKAGGIGLTVALHALVACGVIFSLHRTFIHPVPPPPLVVTPLPEPSAQPEQPKNILKEPDRPQVTIPTILPPPVDIKPDERTLPTPIINTGKKTEIEISGGKGGEGSGGGSGGESKTGIPVSNPAITNLDRCKPEYPRSSLLKEESGTVRVRFEIGADSKLIAASVLHSSGYSTLDKAAVNALSQCQFKAAQQDGVAVSSSLVTDYVWKLDNE